MTPNPYHALDSSMVVQALRAKSDETKEAGVGRSAVDVGLLDRAAYLLELWAPKPERTYESPEREASDKAMASLLKASACMHSIDRGDIGARIGNMVDELQAEFYPEQVNA